MVDRLEVLVIGAGAIGGYFGAVLAGAGHAVTMVAREQHLTALRDRGVEIVGGPDACVAPVRAVQRAADAPRPDLVLFAVKTYDTEAAAADLRPLVDDATLVLELQNGVDRAEAVQAALGRGTVLAGTVYMESQLDAPGVVRYLSGARRILFGQPDRTEVPATVAWLRGVLQAAGIDAVAPADVRHALWGKFVLVCAANALTALTRSPFGQVLTAPHGPAVVADLLGEAVAVGRACGVDLGEDAVDRSAAFLTELGPRLRSSMLRDLERGRPVEVDALNGTVVRLGEQRGIAVGCNRLVTLALSLHNQRVEGESA